MKAQKSVAFAFEEDYLIRTHSTLTNSPDKSLTELVANAWDAGASKVEINIPKKLNESLIVKDDGTGMTYEEFQKRWMTLAYNRLKNQGEYAEFPPGREKCKQRRVYGRNGIGRHGMLCFSDEYTVETSKNGECNKFVISLSSGNEPYKIAEEVSFPKEEHGTKLIVKVERNLPEIEKIREILSARFLYDPSFEVYVNGKCISLEEHKGLIKKEYIKLSNDISAEVIVIDSTKSARTTQKHGIAFWVGGRLVGQPSWDVGGKVVADGRTKIAKRHTIIVRSDSIYDEVLPDWSGFRKSPIIQRLNKKVYNYVNDIIKKLMRNKVKETKKNVLRDHRSELVKLRTLGKNQVSEFVETLTYNKPFVNYDFLSAALEAIINLENSRGGTELLRKISTLTESDINNLNKFLDDWSIKDALAVLDEIDRRILVIEGLQRFSKDREVDELHTLHPLVTQSRWLFGPEFDSSEYTSNVTLKTISEEIFNVTGSDGRFLNSRKRPDIFIREDATLSVVGTESIDYDTNLAEMKRILIIELKRGGFKIGRKEIHQAENYVEDFLQSGLLEGNPRIDAFVVGYEISDKANAYRKVGKEDNGRIQACTYGQLVRTASKRLFKLREVLYERYGSYTDDNIVEQVLREPEQLELIES